MNPSFKTFSHFSQQQNLLQAYSTRNGGYSKAPYHSLNLGMHSGDHKPTVEKNRQFFFNQINIPQQRLIFPEQVHSDHIIHATSPGIVPECDALITAEKNLFLTIQTADCFPIFLFDPQAEVVGIVHSGWRGTSKNIVGKAISLMEEKLSCQSKDIIAGIASGVQQSCYQVDETTAAHFDETYLIADGPGHFKLDVQGNIIDQLKDAGLSKRNIQWDATCTHCAADIYYSYRRDGLHSGRMMGVIGMFA